MSSFFLSSNTEATTAAATMTTTTTTTFEPVLNVPALGSFLVIMTMALLLRLRVGAIGDAAERRIAALKELRLAKSNQLANNDVSAEQVERAAVAYQTALEEEESLRTLIPGIRLRAPNNPQLSEQDRQAVRQFLTPKTTTMTGNTTTTTTTTSSDSTILQSMLTMDEQQQQLDQEYDPPSNLPPIALNTLWLFLIGSQIMLFFFLQMDDTTANEVFNSLSSSSSNSDINNYMLHVEPQQTVAESIGDLMGME